MADTTPAVPTEEKKIPLTEDVENEKKIPKAVFLENVEAWVERYGG